MRTPPALRLLTSAAICALAIGEASAQPPEQTPPPPPTEPADEEKGDEIFVTGSRIPRKDLTSASPVATYDREEITEFGTTVLEDFVNTLPQIKPDFGKTSNNPGDGSSSIDLRGLGAGRTLVLLNGRRVAPSGTGSAIDVNVIPGAMIERVEIVSGGASAVYGSDAVTGAVNFITRKDFTGVEASAQADVYGAGDGQVYNASIVGGLNFAEGRGHAAVFADFLKRQPVFQGDREFTERVFLELGGALVPSGSGITPAGRTLTGGPSLIFNPDGTVRPFSVPADLYNFAPANYLQTPLTRWSAGAFAEFEASETIDLYAELMYARPSARRELAPPPAPGFTAPLVINGPFFPASTRAILRTRYDPDNDGFGTVRFSKRFDDTGSRIFTTQREYWRGVLGFQARVAPTWTIDAFYSYARNDNSEALDNAVSLSRVLQGLNINPVTGACTNPSNGCVAVNVFGDGNISPAAQDFIRVTGLANLYSTVQHNAAAVATGELFSWSEGTVQTSIGVEFRRNAASAEADPALATGDALGFNSFAGAEGEISVYEAFSELLVPLLEDEFLAERLELEAGGRYSHYSTAGGVFTWKAGGQWVPFEGLRLTGMWQRAVRAPNVQELFEVAVRDTADVDLSDIDFCAARNDPVGSGLAAVCIAQGMSPAAIGVYDLTPGDVSTFDFISGGNPDLAVERAGSITAGFDYTFDLPVDLTIGADYFSISIEDAISLPDSPLTLCAVVADPGAPVCQAIVRAPSGELVSGRGGPINVGVARATGIDMTLDFDADLPSSFGLGDARFALRSAAAAYFDIGEAQTANSPFIDCAGFYAVGCGAGFAASLPKYQVTSAFSLERGAFTGSLRWRWMSGAENLDPVLRQLAGIPPSPDTAIFSIPGKHYVDLSAVYELFDGVRLRAGVDNVFKTKPPLLGDQQVQANTDPSRYDVFGRRFFIGVNVRLWD